MFPMANMSVVTFQPCVCRSKDELINTVIQLQRLQWQPHPLVRSCKDRGGMHKEMEEQRNRQKSAENQRDLFFFLSFPSTVVLESQKSVTGTSDYFWKMGNFVETSPTHSLPGSLALMHRHIHKLSCVGTHALMSLNTHSCANMQTCRERCINTGPTLRGRLFKWSQEARNISVEIC